MRSFERQIREYYLSKRLDDGCLRELLRETRSPDSRSWLGRRAWSALVAAAVIALIGAVASNWSVRFTRGLTTEIAINHIKKMDMQVETPHYEVVQAGLPRLDFPLLPTRPDLVDSYDLIGGRYCSLGGSPAAQLRLRRHRDGELVTLYVTRLGMRTGGVHAELTSQHGVRVELWRENGLVYGLACDDRSVR